MMRTVALMTPPEATLQLRVAQNLSQSEHLFHLSCCGAEVCATVYVCAPRGALISVFHVLFLLYAFWTCLFAL